MNEFELEEEKTRAEVASYLRTLADGLEHDTKLTFVAGEQSAALRPPETVHFRVKTSTDSNWLGSDDGRSLILEVGWEADDVDEPEELTIINQPGVDHPTPEHPITEEEHS